VAVVSLAANLTPHWLSQTRPPALHHTTQVKDDYMACLAAHAADAGPCAGVAKAYLACRMDR